MSVKAIERKKEEVIQLASKIKEAEATVVVKYDGLTVEAISELRKQLREENIEFAVIKNNISSRAFKEAEYEGMDELFKGPTAVAISPDDVTAAARIINDFGKDNEALQIKGGTLESNVASLEEIKELATLPNKEGMLSMLLSVLEAPVRGLAQVTNQIAESKED